LKNDAINWYALVLPHRFHFSNSGDAFVGLD